MGDVVMRKRNPVERIHALTTGTNPYIAVMIFQKGIDGLVF